MAKKTGIFTEDKKQLKARFRKLSVSVGKQIYPGINKAAKEYKRDLPAFLRKYYGIKAETVKERTEVSYATAVKPTATIRAWRVKRAKGRNSPPSLFQFEDFGTTRTGVRVEIFKGKRTTIKGAFVRTINGNKVVMRRKNLNQKTARPLKGIHGVSIGAMLNVRRADNDREISRLIKDHAQQIAKEIKL